MQSAEEPTADEALANELYWTSDLSVSEITEELDLSKGTLYDLIRPLGAVRSCPECGVEVAWENRTARSKGHLTCPSCEWEGRNADAETFTAPVQAGAQATADAGTAEEWRPERVRVAVGGALLGAAAGLALVLWARRR